MQANQSAGLEINIRRDLRFLLAVSGAGLVACTLLGFAGGWAWWCDLLSHFRLQYAVMLLMVTIITVCLRRWLSATVFALAFAINAFQLAPVWIAPAQPVGPGVALRVLHFNVLSSNTNHEAVGRWIAERGPDLVVVQEANPSWVRSLDRVLADHAGTLRRISRGGEQEGNFGIAVYASPRISVDALDLQRDTFNTPRVDARLRIDGQPFGLVAVHPMPPVGARHARIRNLQLAEAAAALRAFGKLPRLLVGDLNATRWSAPVLRLQQATGLRDSADGWGWRGSWPGGLWWTGGIPIDQVMVSPEAWRVESHRLGPAQGSDHRPVVTDLVLIAASG